MAETRVYRATVVHVDLEHHVATCRTQRDGETILEDVELGSPYAHPGNGQGNTAIPEQGAECYVMYPSDGGSPFIFSYTMPIGHKEGHRGGRIELNPGDQCIAGNERNHVIVRSNGVVEVVSTPLSSIMLFPTNNLVRHTFENMQMLSTLGKMTWMGDSKKGTLLEYRVNEFPGTTESVIVRAGTCKNSLHAPGFDTGNFTSMIGQTGILLEFIVDPEGTGKVYGFHVGSDGRVSTESKGSMALSVLESYEASIGGDVLAMIYGDMGVQVIGDATLQGNNNEFKSILATTITAGTTMSIEAGAGVSISGKTVDIQAKTIMNLTANSVINLSSPTVNIGKGTPLALTQNDKLVAAFTPLLAALAALPGMGPIVSTFTTALALAGTTNTKAS